MRQDVSGGQIITIVDQGDLEDRARRAILWGRTLRDRRAREANRIGWFSRWRDHPEFEGWTITGPGEKATEEYLSTDGDNPLVPSPGYGWPLGTHCWYFVIEGHGLRRYATGHTVEGAFHRALFLMVTG